MVKHLVGYFGNINNDIYSLYKDAGYSTLYMHGNVNEFWNRESVYKRLKVDEAVFIDEFDDTSEFVNGYLSDELFYRQAVEKMKKVDKPIFSFLVAASSHTPFLLEGLEDKESKLTVDVGEFEGIPFGNYLQAVNYADYAFGIFVDELKNAGLYDDSVIIVFGDHYGLGHDEQEMMDFVREVTPEYNELTKNLNYLSLLCGIKVPGLDSMKIDTPVSKVDIKPTLLQISGIEDNFSLGMSIFSNKDYALVSNGEIVIQDYYYYNNEWYYTYSGEKVDLDNIDEDIKNRLLDYVRMTYLELDISSSILVNDLFKEAF